MWKLLTVFVGLAAGNFVYQAFNQELWAVATERTYFQAWAILGVWLIEHVRVFLR